MIEDSLAEFSRTIDVEVIGEGALELDIKANEQECAALADRFELISMAELSAHLILTHQSNQNLIKLKADFTAEVTQRCVVTLKPVNNKVSGSFTSSFSEITPDTDEDILEINVEDEDPPEPIVDGAIEVGEIVVEHFGLELDPFPRVPDVDFEAIKNDVKAIKVQEEADNPFAVLKKLK